MDELFRDKPWITPLVTMDTSNYISPSCSSTCSNSSTSVSKSPSPSVSSERPQKRK